jgi:hypothetical protein
MSRILHPFWILWIRCTFCYSIQFQYRN